MRLEKREITLNESDSLKDMYFLEKMLLLGHVEGLMKVSRKEARGEFLRLIKETGETVCLIQDLLESRKCER